MKNIRNTHRDRSPAGNRSISFTGSQLRQSTRLKESRSRTQVGTIERPRVSQEKTVRNLEYNIGDPPARRTGGCLEFMESKREKHEVGRRGRESSHNWITLTREAPVSSSWGPHVYPPASPRGYKWLRSTFHGVTELRRHRRSRHESSDRGKHAFFLHTYVKKRYLCEVERGEGWKRKKKAKGNCGAWVYACGREKSRKEEYKERIKWPRSWSVEKASGCFFWIFASRCLIIVSDLIPHEFSQ